MAHRLLAKTAHDLLVGHVETRVLIEHRLGLIERAEHLLDLELSRIRRHKLRVVNILQLFVSKTILVHILVCLQYLTKQGV